MQEDIFLNWFSLQLRNSKDCEVSGEYDFKIPVKCHRYILSFPRESLSTNKKKEVQIEENSPQCI